MNGAFYIGATGLSAQQRALEVVADNITNMNSPGFKRSEVRFAELVAPPQLDPADGEYFGRSIGELNGVSVAAVQSDFSQGELRATGKAMDVAIDGDGFFELIGPAGRSVLWRGGTLQVNADGYLAASNGMLLRSMISVPADATGLTIGADGKVSAQFAGDAPSEEIGRLELVQPKSAAEVTAMPDGVFAPLNDADLRSADPGDDGMGALVQGSVEGSNVELSTEMITLMLMQRSYAANAQVVQAGDQLMGIANNLKR